MAIARFYDKRIGQSLERKQDRQAARYGSLRPFLAEEDRETSLSHPASGLESSHKKGEAMSFSVLNKRPSELLKMHNVFFQRAAEEDGQPAAKLPRDVKTSVGILWHWPWSSSTRKWKLSQLMLTRLRTSILWVLARRAGRSKAKAGQATFVVLSFFLGRQMRRHLGRSRRKKTFLVGFRGCNSNFIHCLEERSP